MPPPVTSPKPFSASAFDERVFVALAPVERQNASIEPGIGEDRFSAHGCLLQTVVGRSPVRCSHGQIEQDPKEAGLGRAHGRPIRKPDMPSPQDS